MNVVMIIVFAAVFFGVASLTVAIGLLLSGGARATANEERLSTWMRQVRWSNSPVSDRSEHSAMQGWGTAAFHWLERLLPADDRVLRWLQQAQLPWSTARFFAVTAAVTLAGFLAGVVSGLPAFLTGLIACSSLAVVPGYVAHRRRRRLHMFANQLPEALELLSRALRAGHGLSAAMQLVATEFPDPLGSEFRRCCEEQQLGKPLDQSLDALASRIPNLDLRFFATAVILQRQTGGDLAELLDKIAGLIRERHKLVGQVRALTAEGRLSGVVLLALPPALMALLWRLNPDYCRLLFDEPIGQKLLFGALAMQLLGAFVIRRIVRIRVS